MMRVLAAVLALLAAAAAPADFELFDLAGSLRSSARLRSADGGRLLAVDFFAVECAPCREALPAWAKAAEALGARGLRIAVVAVALDDDREAGLARTRAYFAEHPVPFPVLWDKYGVVARRFGVVEGGTARLPRSFLLDGDGRIAARADEPGPILAEAARRLP